MSQWIIGDGEFSSLHPELPFLQESSKLRRSFQSLGQASLSLLGQVSAASNPFLLIPTSQVVRKERKPAAKEAGEKQGPTLGSHVHVCSEHFAHALEHPFQAATLGMVVLLFYS